MDEERKKRSAVLWIIVAIGATALVAAGLIMAAFLLFATGRVSSSLTKHVEAPALAPVTGTITLDGKPLKSAIVKFVPVVDPTKGPMRGSTSFGFTDTDGKYTLIYATGDDGKPVMGAVVGPHQVQIQLNDLSGEQSIPARYGASQSDLKADVKQGMPPVDIALKSETVKAPE
jgi:hypothetical protein